MTSQRPLITVDDLAAERAAMHLRKRRKRQQWLVVAAREIAAGRLAPPVSQPYLGTNPTAVRDHKRRVRDAWFTLADRHIAGDRTVESAAADNDAARSLRELVKLNDRAHALHVRRREKLKTTTL
jgi:hypothetical protein